MFAQIQHAKKEFKLASSKSHSWNVDSTAPHTRYNFNLGPPGFPPLLVHIVYSSLDENAAPDLLVEGIEYESLPELEAWSTDESALTNVLKRIKQLHSSITIKMLSSMHSDISFHLSSVSHISAVEVMFSSAENKVYVSLPIPGVENMSALVKYQLNESKSISSLQVELATPSKVSLA